jgi:hypothetical protein
MKKVSTTATMQSRNISVQQKLTIGLDLGDRNSWYCVLNEAGERRSVRTTAQQQPNDRRDSCIKTKRQNQNRSRKRNDKSQSRVPVTALMAWATFHS